MQALPSFFLMKGKGKEECETLLSFLFEELLKTNRSHKFNEQYSL